MGSDCGSGGEVSLVTVVSFVGSSIGDFSLRLSPTIRCGDLRALTSALKPSITDLSFDSSLIPSVVEGMPLPNLRSRVGLTTFGAEKTSRRRCGATTKDPPLGLALRDDPLTSVWMLTGDWLLCRRTEGEPGAASKSCFVMTGLGLGSLGLGRAGPRSMSLGGLVEGRGGGMSSAGVALISLGGDGSSTEWTSVLLIGLDCLSLDLESLEKKWKDNILIVITITKSMTK